MTSRSSIDAAKQAMREDMEQRRDELDDEARVAAAQALAEIDVGFAGLPERAVVSGYVAMRSELDPLALMTRLSQSDHPLALPVTTTRGNPLLFRLWSPGAPLERGRFATRHPGDDAQETAPDVLLVPLLAFDTQGYRLGYGAGFYDRTLSQLRARKSIIAIGIAYDIQKVEIVPHDRYDQPLDWVLTPSGPLRTERA